MEIDLSNHVRRPEKELTLYIVIFNSRHGYPDKVCMFGSDNCTEEFEQELIMAEEHNKYAKVYDDIVDIIKECKIIEGKSESHRRLEKFYSKVITISFYLED